MGFFMYMCGLNTVPIVRAKMAATANHKQLRLCSDMVAPQPIERMRNEVIFGGFRSLNQYISQLIWLATAVPF